MKKNIDIKAIIKKRIENKSNNVFFIKDRKMNERDLRRISGEKINVESLTRDERRNYDLISTNPPSSNGQAVRG